MAERAEGASSPRGGDLPDVLSESSARKESYYTEISRVVDPSAD